jgi:DNA mismatch repair protein MutS
MALVKEYFELTKKYKNEYGAKTLILMQVGAFFEVYGLEDKSNAKMSGSEIAEFSRICDLNIADKKICVGTDSVVMAGFSHYMIDKYLKKLQEVGFTVVVYTQDEQNKNTTRSLSGIYSPGTYFSLDSSPSSQITNNTTCIWINLVDSQYLNHHSTLKSKNKERNFGCEQLIYVGLANIDVYTGKTSIFEFNETYVRNPTTFDELERFISIYNPSEVILIGNISEKEMDEVINYSNIESKSIHKICVDDPIGGEKVKRVLNCEKQIYQKELLTKFYKIDDFDSFYQNFYQNSLATQAFCFLLDFIYQHNPNLVNKISEPKFENCSDRLILANHSLKQLNIIDDDNYRGKYSSVEKMLNLCITSMGKRKFSYHLLNPTTDVEFLTNEYNITEHLLAKINDYDFLKNKLGLIKDISKLVRQIIMKKLSPKSLVQFYKNLKVIQTDFFSQICGDSVFTEYLQKNIPNFSQVAVFCKEIYDFIESNVDVLLCEDIETTVQFELNFIKKGIDKELDERNETLLESNDKLEAIRCFFNKSIMKYEKNAKSNATTDYVKIHETEKNSFSLVATKRRCSILKESFLKDNKCVQLQYKSSFDNQTKSFEFKPELVFVTQTASNDSITSSLIQELCKNISSIKIQMKDIITKIYLSILDNFEQQYLEKTDTIIDFITLTDVSYTKAYIAKKYNYCKPIIVESEKSFVNSQDLRHCLIEHLQQNEIYVANDLTLGVPNGNSGILLYGTNAVGKTSFIRAIGIAVVMAQAGLYVPCSFFEFQPYKYIFTRILGNDNIFKGLSTFAVEMSELRTILRLADEKSLILGDELCSGTESISAVSIFVAGIRQLHDKKSTFIFATHLHEIIHYEEICELRGVVLKHMSVLFDREKGVLVYDRKLRDGPGDNMYGLEVCKSLNLPQSFLELAHSIRMKYHPSSGSILSLKTSHYNSKKIVGVCEMCREEMGEEVHHLQHQADADEDGIIKIKNLAPFHKNKVANLVTLCEKCHDKMHSSSNEESTPTLTTTTETIKTTKKSVKRVTHKKVKTSQGVQLEEL